MISLLNRGLTQSELDSVLDKFKYNPQNSSSFASAVDDLPFQTTDLLVISELQFLNT
jgi:hypothetical protein